MLLYILVYIYIDHKSCFSFPAAAVRLILQSLVNAAPQLLSQLAGQAQLYLQLEGLHKQCATSFSNCFAATHGTDTWSTCTTIITTSTTSNSSSRNRARWTEGIARNFLCSASCFLLASCCLCWHFVYLSLFRAISWVASALNFWFLFDCIWVVSPASCLPCECCNFYTQPTLRRGSQRTGDSLVLSSGCCSICYVSGQGINKPRNFSTDTRNYFLWCLLCVWQMYVDLMYVQFGKVNADKLLLT